MTGAIADCERVKHWFWGQPVNSATALAFVVSGAWIVRRGLVPVGVATALVGIGSFLFHGPMPPGSDWAHDVTLAWLLAVVGLVVQKRQEWALPTLVILAVLIAAAPASFDLLAASLTIATAIALVTGEEREAAGGPALLLTAAAVVGRLSATGGPLCRPASIWQGHGLWHLAAAGAVAWWAHRWLDRIPGTASWRDGVRPAPALRLWRRG